MNSMRHTFIIIITLIGLSRLARAESDIDTEARDAFKDGIAAFDEGRLSDALVDFQRAYSLRPAFKLLYNIGQAQSELGLTRQAISTFEKYLRDGGDNLEPNRKLTVQAELSRLRVLAGVQKGNPDSAARPDLKLKITITPHRESHRFAKLAPWIFGGMAVATAVTGTVLGVRAGSLNKTLNAKCTDGECPPQYQDDIDSMNHSAVATDVLFVSTAALTAAAVSIFVAARHKKKGKSK